MSDIVEIHLIQERLRALGFHAQRCYCDGPGFMASAAPSNAELPSYGHQARSEIAAWRGLLAVVEEHHGTDSPKQPCTTASSPAADFGSLVDRRMQDEYWHTRYLAAMGEGQSLLAQVKSLQERLAKAGNP